MLGEQNHKSSAHQSNASQNPPVESSNTAGGGKDSFAVSAPSISLPKGGGAIHGMGEKFAANPVTGTGSMSVPIAVSPGRSGFAPQLALSYDSGAGNGPFGLGWNLSLPAITRKTDKGLPKYNDANESDVFILSGAEDLVPVLTAEGAPEDLPIRTVDTIDYKIVRYRPRIEGIFARIERWTNQKTGDTHWRSISKDNLLTIYGLTKDSRIADPQDESRIFSWLICETRDDKGNGIVYQYLPENSVNLDLAQANERNRGDEKSLLRTANQYLKRIKYGNTDSLLVAGKRPVFLSDEQGATAGWLFEVVFDYGDEPYKQISAENAEPIIVQAAIGKQPIPSWAVRKDPFSSYRSGFEVRTYRLCQRVLMYHHFQAELDIANYLVRSTEFTYNQTDPESSFDQTAIASFITTVTQSGYLKQGENTWIKKSLPPVEFEYSKAVIQEDLREIDTASLANLPYGLDGSHYQWTDLDGEGISGILTEQAGAWFYKPNLGDAHFGSVQVVAQKPAIADLNGGQQLLDLAGDGQLDLVQFSPALPGFHERTFEGGWSNFTTFKSLPNLDWRNPNLKFVDLTGDGHADILIAEDDVFTWYPSLAEEGFGRSERVRKAFDEEKGPRLVFADGTQAIFLADFSGDGLTDIVRIRNGEVCYWPNLGYGKFGAKVTMDNAPWFDTPDLFDQRRIRLADIDGSGVTDIIYLGSKGIELYFNQSGNSWSEARTLSQFPRTDNLSSVTVVDLFGNGTACLVWSSPLPGHARRPMFYIDLMGGQKPHLMIASKNNLGAETRVNYVASTKFYLEAKAKGTPWITRLPFPVHVIERTETYDRISRNRFVSRYAYHHGYFDGIEREFRGFAMVEQWDTEEISNVAADDTSSIDVVNWDAASFVPPIHTKTWFHTGAFINGEDIARKLAQEYYGSPPLTSTNYQKDFNAFYQQETLPDTLHPTEAMTAEEMREAVRSLKGAMLRQEVYADDVYKGASETIINRASVPYTVTEQNFKIKQLQSIGKNRHAVYFTHACEARSYHYERNPNDPRINHAITIDVDPYGNVLKSVAIGYGRKSSDLTIDKDKQKQMTTLLTWTENEVTNAVDDPDNYRTPIACEARTYELNGFEPANKKWFTASDFLKTASLGKPELDFEKDHNYEEVALTGGRERRLIEHVRTVFRKDDLTGLLPLGDLESLALPGEAYKLAFTPGLLANVYQRGPNKENLLPDLSSVLGDEGKYLDLDNNNHWWIPSGRVFFSDNENDDPTTELATAQADFFLPRRFRDPFGNNTIVSYDDAYKLLVTQTKDALGNTVSAKHDYRVLQPKLMTDPNGNQSVAAFDVLGMVVATAIMGKQGEGDQLSDQYKADLTQDEIETFFNAPDPHTVAPSLLGDATSRVIYDLHRFQKSQQPVLAATLVRETHASEPEPAGGLKIQLSFSYSDGFGREIQKKIQAEPGPLNLNDPNAPIVNPRWVGSGWTIFNNKGKPVQQYEPFFDDTHDFKFANIVGVSSTLFYDPAERVIATLHPNHTYEKVVFDPWKQTTYDVNDTVKDEPHNDKDIGSFVADYIAAQPNGWQTWYQQRINDATRPHERRAALITEAHANTPTIAHFDALGRPFLTIADNGTFGKYETRVELDIEGNQRSVTDAQNRVVMIYDYDMLGTRIHQSSMEAGERWMLGDVMGKPIRGWNSRSYDSRQEYDALHRPVALYTSGLWDKQQTTPSEKLVEKIVYGESQPNAEANNLRGKPYEHSDTAGVVTNPKYDFKGNPLESSRRLLRDYKNTPDWKLNPNLEDEIFTSQTTYDALNRPVSMTSPYHDGMKPSVIYPHFNEANLLDSVKASLNGATEADATTFVSNIDYDAKGQRVLIEYGNGAKTTYEYDKLTFRLINLRTKCTGNGEISAIFNSPSIVQNLQYTYDPAGNITSIIDDAMSEGFYDGQQVRADARYSYDAIYRLIIAEGREHITQSQFDFDPPDKNYRDYQFFGLHANPNNMQAVRNYIESYVYDEVGNFQEVNHTTANDSWVRKYQYNEISPLDGNKNNRLSETTVVGHTDKYEYDPHGNMIKMSHLPLMEWDFRDQLQATSIQVVNPENGTGEITYYVYDASGQRIRKVTEGAANAGATPPLSKERIYLGGFEIYREYIDLGKTIKNERETLHLMDDQRRIALVETKTIDNDQQPAVNNQPLLRYQFDNHLGSACLELDEKGAVISYEEFYSYGATSYQVADKTIRAELKRYRFTKMERDEETGMAYHGARYYAAWIGRWASADPIGIGDTLDGYTYSHNAPTNLVDLTGKAATNDENSNKGNTVIVAIHKTAAKRSDDEKKAAEHTREKQSKDPDAKEVTPNDLQSARAADDKNFDNKVDSLAKRIKDKTATSVTSITTGKAETGVELLDILIKASKNGPIQNLVIFTHATDEGLAARENAGLFKNPGSIDERENKEGPIRLGFAGIYNRNEKDEARGFPALDKLSNEKDGQIRFAKNAVVIIIGCSAAGKIDEITGKAVLGEFSIAKELSKSLAITVIASLGPSNQTRAEDSNKAASDYGWYSFSAKVRGQRPESEDLQTKQLDPVKFMATAPNATSPTPRIPLLYIPSFLSPQNRMNQYLLTNRF